MGPHILMQSQSALNLTMSNALDGEKPKTRRTRESRNKAEQNLGKKSTLTLSSLHEGDTKAQNNAVL